ncbi:hypothetical protein [Pedobacter alpinus]|uniref:SGNH/GDSL hydrolase family protein n=1 Tax=Pedobacter alpinus TaxID=1590643 RepID=A0ABW5TUM4_9SPHI
MKILCFIKLSTFLVCGGCNKKTDVVLLDTKPPIETIKSGNLTYLALGDSYTIGQSVEVFQSFPNQLIDQLKSTRSNVSGKLLHKLVGQQMI